VRSYHSLLSLNHCAKNYQSGSSRDAYEALLIKASSNLMQNLFKTVATSTFRGWYAVHVDWRSQPHRFVHKIYTTQDSEIVDHSS